MKTAQPEEIEVLLEHYRKADDTQISHRAHVVLLYHKGWNIREIAEATFKKESTISRWVTAFKKYGMGSIFPGYYQNQNASKLTREQKQTVKHLLEESDLPTDFWSLGSLKKYISARFDVEYESDSSYYAIFSMCNYSYKLPSLFNIRRDDELVEARVTEIREKIAPYLEDESHLVFCADESRVEWSTLKRRAWLKKGKKTIIRERRDRKYQNYIGLLNLKTGEDLLYRLDWQDQEHIIPVLTKLVETYPNKKIIIIWDNAAFHRGKEIREQLGENKPFKNIRLIWLPPYAPDKNPQEFVWRDGKDALKNQVFNRFEDMLSTFESQITGRNYPYLF